MKTFLVVLFFCVTSFGLRAADEQFKFDSLSVSNLAHSIKTNAYGARTQGERDVLMNRIKAFVSQVEKISTNTPPKNKEAIGAALFQMGISMEFLIEASKIEAEKLRHKIRGYTSDTSIVASYSVETAQAESFNVMELEGQLKKFEVFLKSFKSTGQSLTSLTYFMLLSQ